MTPPCAPLCAQPAAHRVDIPAFARGLRTVMRIARIGLDSISMRRPQRHVKRLIALRDWVRPRRTRRTSRHRHVLEPATPRTLCRLRARQRRRSPHHGRPRRHRRAPDPRQRLRTRGRGSAVHGHRWCGRRPPRDRSEEASLRSEPPKAIPPSDRSSRRSAAERFRAPAGFTRVPPCDDAGTGPAASTAEIAAPAPAAPAAARPRRGSRPRCWRHHPARIANAIATSLRPSSPTCGETRGSAVGSDPALVVAPRARRLQFRFDLRHCPTAR